MRRYALVGLTAVSLILLRSVSHAEIIDRVLAVASGDLILLSDVVAAREFGLITTPATATDPVRAALSQLIDRALMLAEVERYAPAEPPADIMEGQLTAIRRRLGAAYERILASCGIDERRLREILREEWLIRAYLDQRFTVPPPTEGDIALYYAEHQAAFVRGSGTWPIEAVRQEIIDALAIERRTASVNEWLVGLHRRADIIDLYQPAR